MVRQKIIYNGVSYYWSASQDSEHPDMTVYMPDHEIYIQVVVNEQDKAHNNLFLKGKKKYSISPSTAYEVIKAVIKQGYIETYKDSNVGLIFDDQFNLIEN
jgi:hypothetical protein